MNPAIAAGEPPIARPAHPAGEDRVAREALAAVLYFDMFKHPLTTAEAFAFLPCKAASYTAFLAAVTASEALGRHPVGGNLYLTAPGRPAAWADERLVKERHARALWRRARLTARLIACVPFVRGLLVTGSLSKNATDPDADIDWFIITAPGRLWLCIASMTLLRVVALFNRKRYFCTNYYVSADALSNPDRNVFVATEIATAVPLLGSVAIQRFFAANAWIRDYLPNLPLERPKTVLSTPVASLLQRVGERAFTGPLGARLEAWLYARYSRRFELKRRAGPEASDLPPARATLQECKYARNEFQDHILLEYATRLEQFGVARGVAGDDAPYVGEERATS